MPRPPSPRDPVRPLVLAGLLALGLVTALGSGGGGGGDDGGGVLDEPAPPFPSVVRYSAGSPADVGGSGVIVAQTGGVTAHLGFYLEGSYAKGPRAYTLEAGPVARIVATFTNLPRPLLHDPLSILVEQPVQWVHGDHPTAGQFRSVPAGTVQVTVTPDAGGTGQPGVDIAYSDFGQLQAATSLTWAELDGVLADPGAWDTYVLEAAFEYQAIVWVFDPVQVGMDGIRFVTENDAALVAAGDGVGIERACDPFPYDGSTGGFHFTWNDGPGSVAGALGPGDRFTATFHDCWTDGPGQTDRWLRSGGAGLQGYWEDMATVTLGFDPVVLNGLVETVTRTSGSTQTLGGTVTVTSFGVNGQAGFRLLTEPDTSAGINLVNAADVASAGVESLLLPGRVGDLGLGLLAGAVADPSFVFCDIGGSAVLAPTPTAATAVPADFVVTFTACRRDPADPSTLDGTVTLKVGAVTGGTLAALTGDTYTAALAVDPIAVDIADSVGTSTLTGGSHFARAALPGDLAETSESVPGGLSVAEAGVTRVLQSYHIAGTRTAGGAFSLGAAGDVMTVAPSTMAGALTVTVAQPVAGTDPDAPASGVLKIVALDGSTLTVTVVNGAVTLGIDTDGDGTVDDTLHVNWDDLT